MNAFAPAWGLGNVEHVPTATPYHMPMQYKPVGVNTRYGAGMWGLGHASHGLGDPTTQLATQLSNAIITGAKTGNAAGAVAGAAAAGLSTTSSVFGYLAATGSTVCPPCAPIFAIGAALVPLIANMFKGCGPSCVQTSNDANQMEQLLQQNLSTYTSLPVAQRTASVQASALANFNTSFNTLVSQCQQIGGQGGSQCVADRQAGACKWKASPWKWNADGTYTPAGQNGSGSQCWNWVYGYHDPIAQDPFVTPDPVSSDITGTLSSLTSGTTAGISNTYLLIGAGLLLLVYLS